MIFASADLSFRFPVKSLLLYYGCVFCYKVEILAIAPWTGGGPAHAMCCLQAVLAIVAFEFPRARKHYPAPFEL